MSSLKGKRSILTAANIRHESLRPLDAAERSDAGELVEWLRGRGAKAASELG